MATLSESDLRHLRAAIALSHKARQRGNGAYGALLVGADGRVLMDAENSRFTANDATGHAELNLVRAATGAHDAQTLAAATLYASAEPCAMCAGAIFWSGVKRVVYALSADRNYALLESSDDELRIGCREVFGKGKRKVEVLGPALEEEAAAAFSEQNPQAARTA
ncbi:MAG: nucleoside deaminase [Burkholderiales bacterium]